MSTKEGRSHLRHKFFKCIRVITKAFTKHAIKP